MNVHRISKQPRHQRAESCNVHNFLQMDQFSQPLLTGSPAVNPNLKPLDFVAITTSSTMSEANVRVGAWNPPKVF